MTEVPASFSDIHGWYGSVTEVERGLANDQLNILGLQSLANAHFAAGMLPEATADLQKCLQLDERLPLAYQILAMIQACQGHITEAISSAEECVFHRPVATDRRTARRIAQSVLVGRTPWSAAGPPAGFPGRSEISRQPAKADEGVGRGPGGPPH